ncbi:hypothetical protein [Ornithinimicrobium panacihumi]|uniref:hypothetical protein n=1 Tax=Ornithinimicrobium panacihumi TaxID=2008449 RepID=UPI003F88B82D
MRIADIMALVVPPVTDLLRRSRRPGGTGQTQPMFPTIIAVRNERVVATVSTPRMEATLHCAQPLAVGVDPYALVLAAEAVVEGSPALAYTIITRERKAKLALQEITGEGEEVRFSTPIDGGEPSDPAILTWLSEAISQEPMAVDKVSRKDRKGTFGQDPFMPAEQGRVVVDAGTLKMLQERIAPIGGRALYIARSPEAGRLALEAGLPRASLLASDRLGDGRPSSTQD